jgi:hypothetical protein
MMQTSLLFNKRSLARNKAVRLGKNFQTNFVGFASLVQNSRASMSFTHNFHQPPVFYINGIKYINDYDLDEYRPQV